MGRDMMLDWLGIHRYSDEIAIVNDRYVVYRDMQLVYDRKLKKEVKVREFKGEMYVYIRDYRYNKPRNVLYAKVLLKCFSKERFRRNVGYVDGNPLNVKFENLITYHK